MDYGGGQSVARSYFFLPRPKWGEGPAPFWPFGGMEGPWWDRQRFGGTDPHFALGGMEGPDQISRLKDGGTGF